MMYYKILQHEDSSREWIIFLHGLGGNSNIWYKQIQEFRKHYNILLVDFYGHGENSEVKEEYSFPMLADEVVYIMDVVGIQRAHVFGISLGSIVGAMLCKRHPERLHSLVAGGILLAFDLKVKGLLYAANVLRFLMPYMWLYAFFAKILMPRKNHAYSRSVFVREAKNLGQKEFMKWFKLLLGFPGIAGNLREGCRNNVPKLFITGGQDHLFLRHVREYVRTDAQATLHVIEKCGHVCNIERDVEFNRVALNYLAGYFFSPAYAKGVRDMITREAPAYEFVS